MEEKRNKRHMHRKDIEVKIFKKKCTQLKSTSVYSRNVKYKDLFIINKRKSKTGKKNENNGICI